MTPFVDLFERHAARVRDRLARILLSPPSGPLDVGAVYLDGLAADLVDMVGPADATAIVGVVADAVIAALYDAARDGDDAATMTERTVAVFERFAYNPDQPRDDHGRWGEGDGLPTPRDGDYQHSLSQSMRDAGIKGPVADRMSATLDQLDQRYGRYTAGRRILSVAPASSLGATVPKVEGEIVAAVQGTTLYLNPRVVTDAKLAAYARDGAIAGGTPEALAAHEYGHQLQSNPATTMAMERPARDAGLVAGGKVTDGARELSEYATADRSELRSEAFASYVTGASGPSWAIDMGRALDEHLGLEPLRAASIPQQTEHHQITSSVLAYNPDQPRDEHGRWGEGDGRSKDTGDKLPPITDPAARGEAVYRALAGVPDTQSVWDKQKDEVGLYKSERQAIHDEIINAKMAEARAAGVPNDNKAVMMAGLPGAGKAQPLNAPVLTPSGWRRIGDLRPGDPVLGPMGDVRHVVDVYAQGVLPIYRCVFSDGAETECCDDHLWTVVRSSARPGGNPNAARRTIPLSAIRSELYVDGGRSNWWVPMVTPMDLDRDRDAGQPLDPYLLGALLGDGGMTGGGGLTFTSADEQMHKFVAASVPSTCTVRRNDDLTVTIVDRRVASVGCSRSPIITTLRSLGLWGKRCESKFVPPIYLWASRDDRLATLQGLLDADGSVSGSHIEFSTTSPALAADVRFLSESLGGTAKTTERITSYTYGGMKRTGRPSFRVYVKLPHDIDPFRLDRKRLRYSPSPTRHPRRSFQSVEYARDAEAVCISLDADDGLYVTNRFVVTHNTYATREVINSSQYIRISSDDMKFELANRGLVDPPAGMGRMEAAPLLHEESSDMARALAERATSEGMNVLYDFTMNSEGAVRERMDQMNASGQKYSVTGVVVSIPVEQSVRAAQDRYERGLKSDPATARYTPPGNITRNADPTGTFRSTNERVFETVKPQFDQWIKVDNTDHNVSVVDSSPGFPSAGPIG